MTRPLIVVGTPCFGGMVSQEYTMSLLQLQAAAPRAGFDMATIMLGNDALISMATGHLVTDRYLLFAGNINFYFFQYAGR